MSTLLANWNDEAGLMSPDSPAFFGQFWQSTRDPSSSERQNNFYINRTNDLPANVPDTNGHPEPANNNNNNNNNNNHNYNYSHTENGSVCCAKTGQEQQSTNVWDAIKSPKSYEMLHTPTPMFNSPGLTTVSASNGGLAETNPYYEAIVSPLSTPYLRMLSENYPDTALQTPDIVPFPVLLPGIQLAQDSACQTEMVEIMDEKTLNSSSSTVKCLSDGIDNNNNIDNNKNNKNNNNNNNSDNNSQQTYTIEELEAFAKDFKQKRITLGFTQGDVGVSLGRMYSTAFSQTTISRFEALNLSFKNMCKLKPSLEKWLRDTEQACKQGTFDIRLLSEDSSTFPIQRRRRKRSIITSQARRLLETAYASQKRPSRRRTADLARQLHLDEEVVRVWFCNRRQRDRRQLTAENKLTTCGFLLYTQNSRLPGKIALIDANH
ncbi:POU domain, class 2, transcription factor 3 [Trichinella pseudospiralis]|uniref:POU domain protein n=1 Tax=Trichinella pseudospiralis TaxID=6337 RepID=A0A0V1G336_TRIPS|nr:POU domain, class 2, transcription factor 3 [Trichinella pseudospiralis]